MPADKKAVVLKHLRTMFLREDLVRYFAETGYPLLEAGHLTMAQAEAAGFELVAQLQTKGQLRLSPQSQRAALRHTLSLSRGLTPVRCKSLAVNGAPMREMVKWERDYLTTVPLPQFEAVLNRSRESLVAELTGFPAAQSVTREQAVLADAIYQKAVAKRLERLPIGLVTRVSEDSASAPPKEVCDFMLASLEAILDMREPYQSWQLTIFLTP